MKSIILLDIDGVLNPVIQVGEDRTQLTLSETRVSLVRELGQCGRVAWVSTWPGEQTAELELQLNLAIEPLRVPLTFRDADEREPTPKLRSVSRWLARMEILGEANWETVVWIDDVLGRDAYEWADALGKPALLMKPSFTGGLSDEHVARVRDFTRSSRAV